MWTSRFCSFEIIAKPAPCTCGKHMTIKKGLPASMISKTLGLLHEIENADSTWYLPMNTLENTLEENSIL